MGGNLSRSKICYGLLKKIRPSYSCNLPPRNIRKGQQENRLGCTGKSLGGYRRIRFGIPGDLHLDNGICFEMEAFLFGGRPYFGNFDMWRENRS